MLAFVGARDGSRADRLVRALRTALLATDPPRHDDAPARTGRVPGPGRVRARRRHARGHAARQPAGAGAPPRRQPRAARRAPPDDAARVERLREAKGWSSGDRVAKDGGRSLPEQGARRGQRRPRAAGCRRAPPRRCACRLRPLLRPKGLGHVAAGTSSHAWSEEQADAEHAKRAAAAHIGRRAATARAACRRRPSRRPIGVTPAARPTRRGTGSWSSASPR